MDEGEVVVRDLLKRVQLLPGPDTRPHLLQIQIQIISRPRPSLATRLEGPVLQGLLPASHAEQAYECHVLWLELTQHSLCHPIQTQKPRSQCKRAQLLLRSGPNPALRRREIPNPYALAPQFELRSSEIEIRDSVCVTIATTATSYRQDAGEQGIVPSANVADRA